MTTEWRRVTEEEAKKFIENYPRKLEKNFFMDTYTWHDFEKYEAEDSILVSAGISYESDKLTWCLRNNQ